MQENNTPTPEVPPTMRNELFFTHNRSFYQSFFRLMAIVAMQNIVAYSVNMADNIMLGRYSQTALSGAATVNQIFFIVQQTTITIGDALVIIASQYWGQKRIPPIRKLTGIIRGSGDTRFSLILNLISTWGIVMPLTFLSAFVWKWPPAAVVCVIQSDQIFKCLPIFFRFRSYKWIKKLTK